MEIDSELEAKIEEGRCIVKDREAFLDILVAQSKTQLANQRSALEKTSQHLQHAAEEMATSREHCLRSIELHTTGAQTFEYRLSILLLRTYSLDFLDKTKQIHGDLKAAWDSHRASMDEKTVQLKEANDESTLDSLVDAMEVSILDAEEKFHAVSGDLERVVKELRTEADQSIVEWRDKLREYLPIDLEEGGIANRTTEKTSFTIEVSGLDDDHLKQTMDRLFPTECIEPKSPEENNDGVSMQSAFMNCEDGEKQRKVLSVAEWQFPTKDLQKRDLAALIVSPQNKECYLWILNDVFELYLPIMLMRGSGLLRKRHEQHGSGYRDQDRSRCRRSICRFPRRPCVHRGVDAPSATDDCSGCQISFAVQYCSGNAEGAILSDIRGNTYNRVQG